MNRGKPHRVCTECGKSLGGKGVKALTCSDNCRGRRSRRIKRQRQEAANLGGAARAYPPGLREVSMVANDEMKDVARDVMAEELTPIVREALTEDVLRSIPDMIALLPAAVTSLKEDLEGDDPALRSKAAALLMKYTIGHPALLRPAEEDAGNQLTVVVGLPRPGLDVGGESLEDVDVIEEPRTCDKCGEEKPATAFVADSNRCTQCWDTQREKVYAEYGDVHDA